MAEKQKKLLVLLQQAPTVMLLLSLLVITALTRSQAEGAKAPSPRPNFLFCLMDDWGFGDLSAYGSGVSHFVESGSYTKTPTLDALAANGTLFTDFHTGQSFCAPSRTSFMTGRWPADLGVNSNWDTGVGGWTKNKAAGLPYQVPLPSGKGASPYPGGLPNIADIMQKAGYATGHFGTLHIPTSFFA